MLGTRMICKLNKELVKISFENKHMIITEIHPGMEVQIISPATYIPVLKVERVTIYSTRKLILRLNTGVRKKIDILYNDPRERAQAMKFFLNHLVKCRIHFRTDWCSKITCWNVCCLELWQRHFGVKYRCGDWANDEENNVTKQQPQIMSNNIYSGKKYKGRIETELSTRSGKSEYFSTRSEVTVEK